MVPIAQHYVSVIAMITYFPVLATHHPVGNDSVGVQQVGGTIIYKWLASIYR